MATKQAKPSTATGICACTPTHYAEEVRQTVENPNWPEAMATVLSCTYTARAGRAMAFGMPSSKHFRISYNYWAEDTLHTGEFYSETAIPQGSLFPIRYDPDLPHQSRHAESDAASSPSRQLLMTIGIAGSVVLSLAWLLVLRGCS